MKENLFEAARSDEKLRSAAFDTSCAMDEILWRLKDLSLIHNDISELISVGCGFGDVAGDLKNVSDKNTRGFQIQRDERRFEPRFGIRA